MMQFAYSTLTILLSFSAAFNRAPSTNLFEEENKNTQSRKATVRSRTDGYSINTVHTT